MVPEQGLHAISLGMWTVVRNATSILSGISPILALRVLASWWL